MPGLRSTKWLWGSLINNMLASGSNNRKNLLASVWSRLECFPRLRSLDRCSEFQVGRHVVEIQSCINRTLFDRLSVRKLYGELDN